MAGDQTGDGVKSYDVFLSHKSEYKPWVKWFGRSLKACGRSVFLDEWDLVPGQSWILGLAQGLEHSRAAVLVATPEVVNSGWINTEYEQLMILQRKDPSFRFVPVVFGDLPNLPFLGTVQAVDARDPLRFQEWFYRVLCGLDGRKPKDHWELPCEIDPPPPLQPMSAATVAPRELAFVNRVMGRLMRPNAAPVMIAARGRRHQGPVVDALRQSAKERYGTGNVLHIAPPVADGGELDAVFAELGRQCGFAKIASTAAEFGAIFEERLQEKSRTFLLVTGFESASEEGRKALAGRIRAAGDRFPDKLRVCLVGGERLAAQKFQMGGLSLLSHAHVEEWPDPDGADLSAWVRQHDLQVTLDGEACRAAIATTGGHAGLLRFSLDRWHETGGTPDWERWSYECPELWEVWYRLRGEGSSLDPLSEQLGRSDLGPRTPWPPNEVVRALYWADLLADREHRLCWRSEIIRQVGREVLSA